MSAVIESVLMQEQSKPSAARLALMVDASLVALTQTAVTGRHDAPEAAAAILQMLDVKLLPDERFVCNRFALLAAPNGRHDLITYTRPGGLIETAYVCGTPAEVQKSLKGICMTGAEHDYHQELCKLARHLFEYQPNLPCFDKALQIHRTRRLSQLLDYRG